MSLKRVHHMNALLSFYESLLTDKQKAYMTLYYREDLSLGEIASNYQVSRQAVYDAIKRSEQTLIQYEEDLHLMEDFRQNVAVIEEAIAYVEEHYAQDHHLLGILKDFKIRE